MKILRRVYSLYCLFVFSILFLILLPLFLLFIQREEWHCYALKLNRLWAILFFFFCFIPLEVEYKYKPTKKEKFVICANHFSFLDIATLALIPVCFVFVGKSSLENIPAFGYMYKKLHITVDRQNLRNRYLTLQRSLEAIDKGKSVVIYPEGGIYSKNPPEMASFKDGAFRLAIEKQISIIPVTLPYNWLILPDDGSFSIYRKKCKVIFHEPISTAGLSIKDLDALKEKTFKVIDDELKIHFDNDTRQKHA
jgi:1-acyl-sn-glycerol-3-phosphate acyltransferase